MKQKCCLIKQIQVSSKENSHVKKNLDKYFNQSEHYLDINKQPPTISSLSQPLFSLHKSKSFIILPLFQMTNKRKITELKKGLLTSSTFIASNKPQIQTSFKVTEEEMNKLFDYYSSNQEKSSMYLANIPNSLSTQSVFRAKISEQERHLKLLKETNDQICNLVEVIKRKLKRNNGSLLMDKIDDYRIKKEAQFLLNKYEPFPDYWKNSLRHKSVECIRQKIDQNQVVVNNSTIYNPNWEIKSKDYLIEKIRNPSKRSEIKFDKLSKTLNDSNSEYDNNSKISRDLTKMKELCSNASSLNVVGKSLFKTEYEMFKLMKGKKFICTVLPKDIKDDDLFNKNNNNKSKTIDKNRQSIINNDVN